MMVYASISFRDQEDTTPSSDEVTESMKVPLACMERSTDDFFFKKKSFITYLRRS